MAKSEKETMFVDVHGHEKKHPYHLVDPSPWPIVASLGTLIAMIGAVLLMHKHGPWVFAAGMVILIYTAIGWWRDVFKEGDHQRQHTQVVQQGLKIGMALFIVSEVMFFAAFFWAFFDASIFPKEATGLMWPPKGIITLDPFHLPYLNTLLLLLSGTTVTWAHHELRDGNMKEVVQGLALTVLLGLTFTCVQVFEYMHASFKFKEGIYPSTFYMATGFHGAHVIIGTIFLIVCFFRARSGGLTKSQHVGFEAAAWYWHFVDVVWLFLFVSIYWWGGAIAVS